jgi:small conductance mechanosensitive channel
MASEFLDNSIYVLKEIYSKLIIKVVVALIIILIGFLIGKILGRLLFRLLHEIKLNTYFSKATGINVKMDDILSKGLTYLIDFFVLIIAVDAVAFTPSLIYILSGAVIVIIIFSVLIGIKDIIPNIIAGLIIYKKGDFSQGDTIKIKEHTGIVDKITLLETIIIKKNNDRLYVPNSSLLSMDVLKKGKKKVDKKD